MEANKNPLSNQVREGIAGQIVRIRMTLAKSHNDAFTECPGYL